MKTITTMTVEGKEEKDILNNEIESWKGFEYALREENRLLFSKMLSEYQQNEDYDIAAISRGECYSAESFFMALILQQQKMISQLIDRLAKSKV
jgi:hypothetical protein